MSPSRGKPWYKRLVVAAIARMPPLPVWVFETYLKYRLGSTPGPIEVDYVSPNFSEEGLQRLGIDQLPSTPEGFLRIVIVSDTHERHNLVTLPPGDVLLHCGDILQSSSLTSLTRGRRCLEDFNQWLAEQPCKEKVVIGGNHDYALEKLGKSAEEVLSNAVLLQDSAIDLPVSGLRVYGNGFSVGTSHNRAWQTATPEVSIDQAKDADIVMTHSLNQAMKKALKDAGVKARLWAFGHVHKAHGVSLDQQMLLVNAAINDEKYRPWQPPVVVDLARTNPGEGAECRRTTL